MTSIFSRCREKVLSAAEEYYETLIPPLCLPDERAAIVRCSTLPVFRTAGGVEGERTCVLWRSRLVAFWCWDFMVCIRTTVPRAQTVSGPGKAFARAFICDDTRT